MVLDGNFTFVEHKGKGGGWKGGKGGKGGGGGSTGTTLNAPLAMACAGTLTIMGNTILG